MSNRRESIIIAIMFISGLILFIAIAYHHPDANTDTPKQTTTASSINQSPCSPSQIFTNQPLTPTPTP